MNYNKLKDKLKDMRASALRATMFAIGTIFAVAGILGAVTSIKDPSMGMFSIVSILFSGGCLRVAFFYTEVREVKAPIIDSLTARSKDEVLMVARVEVMKEMNERLKLVEEKIQLQEAKASRRDYRTPAAEPIVMELPQEESQQEIKPKTEKKKSRSPAKKKLKP